MRFNHTGRVPPSDGVSHWRFPVGGGVTIRGKGHDDLLKNVFEYRLRNNQDIGDIEREISDYYCGQYPNFCFRDAADENPANPSIPSESMLNRVSRWASAIAHRMPRGGYPLVTPAEAERRGATCLQCPRNVGWRGGCGGCSSITLQLLQSLKAMRKTRLDGNLNGCQIAGFELTTAVHLPVSATSITDAQRASMPAQCWRKAEP